MALRPRALARRSHSARVKTMVEQRHCAGPTCVRGRQRETAILDGALSALAVAGRGGVIAIKGDRGSGRTTLLDACARRARRDGTAFLHAAAVPAERGTPLKPLADALGETGLSADDVERRLERATARGPVIVAIDDLHEADDATLQTIRTLAHRLADRRLLWLLTLTAGRADMTARALTRAGGDALLRIGPLDRDAVHALACDVLGARPDQAVVHLVDDLGGHPASIVELLGALVAERLVEITEGSARLTGQGLRHVLCDLGVRRPRPDAGPSAHSVLTRSELAVVELVARGATNRQAAEQLFLSPHTVSSHLRHAFEKLGVRSRVELAILFAGTMTAA
jgi:DNA-binding CsgD family transcriptional regulator